MSRESFCQLTAGDVNVLMSMLHAYCETPGLFRAFLREKLNHAEIYFKDDIPSDVVTLDSHVLYTVNGQDTWLHVLVRSSPEGLPDFALSVHTMRGLALLGLAEGEKVECYLEDGGLEVLQVVTVTYQPEARESKTERSHAAPSEAIDNAPQVLTFKPRLRSLVREPDDDPGPSAA
ncbi:hypothetical protein ASD54_21650 [Rhizobium sp. Root149]|uniref:hypothetical protein n=1 Tax=Rhizobium sp. Root149 TaxID=1736473 RepID=UPI0007131AEA|nr:hypothetical protein [Rhizobium sp. Root149]KQZ46626.1 hypothetical protein ASD54_21650 [Rhizobium sp. Root149]